MEEKTLLTIFFSLFDEILYEVAEEKTLIALCLKFEKLFMKKFICNNLLLTRLLLELHIEEGGSL